ncbi:MULTISPECIES: hypothetical protein [Vibrio]|uniref:hypothetical protein n=1 Tax=Vibrio TaxID=662 RepID=UPI0004DF629D|nr:hypothetical protein [Vibrio parahaemolyticus]EGQ9239972.1 hypothetical protein [Vibrio vulnificus]EHD1697941.1 hypothetical protein [Vibrio vulnificus]EKZ9225741.1 hypothetical protein [Vibrio vulnificus]ELC9582586.1 hypothetical protein [Vibrio vulnificus]MCU8150254.1 hypothetical protein [Vibrio vulnificus]
MKKSVFIFLAFMMPFFATASMTEQECKSQAMAVNHLLEMVEDGILPNHPEYVEKLYKAEAHIKKGEYCAARTIILNLQK